MQERTAILNEQALEDWQRRRDIAAQEEQWREAEKPCVLQPLVFAYAEEIPEAARQAKLMCETSCPVLEQCKQRILRIEVGQRAGTRCGIVAGLTGRQRALLARERGCGVCGAKLVDSAAAQSLYCRKHGVRGARDQALEGGVA